MKTKSIKEIVQEQFRKLFEEISSTSLYGGGVTVSNDSIVLDTGTESFNNQAEEFRFVLANEKFEELKKQFNGDQNKALENMPDYMLLYIS